MFLQGKSDLFTFLKQYVRNPRSVGAVLPSSDELVKKMVEAVDFDHAQCIVELGAGTGRFTEQILARRGAQTHLVLIESDPVFYEMLERRFGHLPDVHLFHDSAENIQQIVRQLGWEKVDYVLSGLPFASLPLPVSHAVLACSQRVLGTHGRFVLFQYTRLKLGLIRSYFPHVRSRRVFWNVPPAYVLECGTGD